MSLVTESSDGPLTFLANTSCVTQFIFGIIMQSDPIHFFLDIGCRRGNFNKSRGNSNVGKKH